MVVRWTRDPRAQKVPVPTVPLDGPVEDRPRVCSGCGEPRGTLKDGGFIEVTHKGEPMKVYCSTDCTGWFDEPA